KEYEAEKERIDRERSEHVLKVVAQKEAKRQESEARLIPKKPSEVSETVSAPDVKALVEEERTRAAFEVMGEDLTVKLDETLKGVEHVTDEDRERFGNSIAGVKETKCYFDVIISMLLVVGDLFSGLDEYPANVGKFRIELSDPDVVVSEPFRRIRRDWSQEIYEQLIDMERKKVIRPSTTEFHCATVIVPKKNGKLRLCVDYRPLNRVTKGMGQVLPVIDDLFQLMGGTKFYAVLDLTSGYWQV
ncbi:hypothetical protein ADUPG1_005816, partial [Aduncisulcus paluster]